MTSQTYSEDDRADLAGLLRAATIAQPLPTCPEIALHLPPPEDTLESFRVRHETRLGLAPPYWARAWPGGLGLARFVLDHPQVVTGRHVLDVGSGSGLVAIAAALAGAARVQALDRDPNAVLITRLNARLNRVDIGARVGDFATLDDAAAEVVLAADLWYDKMEARRITPRLRACAGGGAEVLLGDPMRAHFPRRGIKVLAECDVPASMETEGAGTASVRVCRLLPGVAPP